MSLLRAVEIVGVSCRTDPPGLEVPVHALDGGAQRPDTRRFPASCSRPSVQHGMALRKGLLDKGMKE